MATALLESSRAVKEKVRTYKPEVIEALLQPDESEEGILLASLRSPTRASSAPESMQRYVVHPYIHPTNAHVVQHNVANVKIMPLFLN